MQDALSSDGEGEDSTGYEQPSSTTEAILEVSEPPSPEPLADNGEDGPSVIANLLRKSPPESATEDSAVESGDDDGDIETVRVDSRRRKHSATSERHSVSENTPLLYRTASHPEGRDLEEQKPKARRAWLQGMVQGTHDVKDRVAQTVGVAVDPRRWDRKLIWQRAVLTPASCLPSVAVGLLLNILDALSYGKNSMTPRSFASVRIADASRHDPLPSW